MGFQETVKGGLSNLRGSAVMTFARVLPTPKADVPDLTGKTALVTGSNSGIGFHLSKRLAAAGATVVLLCRNEEKARAAVDEIKQAVPGAEVSYEIVDFASLASVRAFVKRWTRPVDFLVNNAGGPMNNKLTADGLEGTYLTNHLAHFLLTLSLLPRLTKTARIVSTSSHTLYTSDKLTVDKRNGEDVLGKLPEGADLPMTLGLRLYARAKIAQAIFTRELQRRLAGTEITATCFHPGFVQSDLYTKLTPGALHSRLMMVVNALGIPPEAGAETPLFLLTQDVQAKGGYFDRCGERWLPGWATDEKLAKDFWQAWLEDAGLKKDPLPSKE